MHKNIMISGASGFIGRPLVDMLCNQGRKIKVIVRNKKNFFPENVKQIIIPDILNILDGNSVELKNSLSFDDVDVFIHMAAHVHLMNFKDNQEQDVFQKINFDASLTLAKLAEKNKVKRFIFISTIKVNGENTVGETRFFSGSPYAPKGAYSQSKCEAEKHLLALSKISAMDIVIIRPPLVYGPYVKANFHQMVMLVNNFPVFPMPIGKKNSRSLVSVYNLIDLISVCIDHKNASNQIFAVSDGDDVSIKLLVTLIANCLVKKIIFVPVPMLLLKLVAMMAGKSSIIDRLYGSLKVDITHTCKTLNWSPPVSLADGIKHTVSKINEESK